MGKNTVEAKTWLDKHYGVSAPGKSTICDWYSNFKRGCKSTEDSKRSGRPKEVIIPEIIRQVRQIVLTDRRVKEREIAETVGISTGSAVSILHDHLDMKKLNVKWVPHFLDIEQREKRVADSKSCLDMFNRNPSEFLRRYITMDETWIHHYIPESNRSSAEWQEASESRSKRVKASRRAVKTLFDHAERDLSLDNPRQMTDEQLDVRMDFLNKTESTFTLTHDSLEELGYDEIGSQLRHDFEELIINIKSVVLREIRKRQTQIGPCSTSTMRREPNIEGSTTIIHQRKSNVPELKLPEFSGGYTEKVVTVGPDTDHDYFAGTEGKSRIDSLRKTTTKDVPGTADSSWTTVRTVGGTKKSLCRIKVTRVTGTRVTYESSWATVQTMSTTKEAQLPKGENAGITVRTVGIATDGRYCWNQGNLRILVGHGADHEYHEGNAVTERENVGITVRTVGIVNVGATGGTGTDHDFTAITVQTGKGNDEHQGARKPPKAHCGHGVNRGDNNGTWLLTVMLCVDFRTRSDDADRGTYGRKKATKDVRNTGEHYGN
ncbi:hypothetical protein ACLKA6_008449 [Drosophila palustris]